MQGIVAGACDCKLTAKHLSAVQALTLHYALYFMDRAHSVLVVLYVTATDNNE